MTSIFLGESERTGVVFVCPAVSAIQRPLSDTWTAHISLG